LWTPCSRLGQQANGGETTRENLTLLCTYHHRLLHEGGFRVERGGDGSLCFTRADGRVVPSCGYRLKDFTDDGLDGDPAEVREPAAVYAAVPRSKPRGPRSRWSADVLRAQ
jgi:hypothetical protein